MSATYNLRQPIVLISGRTVYRDQIALASDGVRFTIRATGQDVTRDLYLTDKKTFPGFDLEASNFYYANASKLDDSTASNFVNILVTDPLTAPLSALDKGVKQIFSSVGVWGVVGVVVFGVAVFLAVKHSDEILAASKGG